MSGLAEPVNLCGRQPGLDLQVLVFQYDSAIQRCIEQYGASRLSDNLEVEEWIVEDPYFVQRVAASGCRLVQTDWNFISGRLGVVKLSR